MVKREENQPQPPRRRILRWKQLKHIVSMHRVTVWRKVQKGEFPEPVKLSVRASGWREEDIIAWLNGLKPRST
jgi:prophage regulatory protein